MIIILGTYGVEPAFIERDFNGEVFVSVGFAVCSTKNRFAFSAFQCEHVLQQQEIGEPRNTPAVNASVVTRNHLKGFPPGDRWLWQSQIKPKIDRVTRATKNKVDPVAVPVLSKFDNVAVGEGGSFR